MNIEDKVVDKMTGSEKKRTLCAAFIFYNTFVHIYTRLCYVIAYYQY